MGSTTPETDGLEDLTWWVWPESLIAPISFTAAHLESKGGKLEDWREWWCSEGTEVYQFIGEDNVYFYGIAEMAMFLGQNGSDISQLSSKPENGKLQLPQPRRQQSPSIPRQEG